MILKGKKILLGELTPLQMSQMSLAALNAHIISLQASIADIERELSNPNIEESTKAGMRANIAYYRSLIYAIQGWLALSSQERARTNGANYIRNTMSQYSAQNQQPGNWMPYDTGNGFFDSLTMNMAGLPVWAWGLIIAAGGYMIYERMNA